MTFQMSWCMTLLAWVLLEIGLRSWQRPERFDSSWGWTWPAPTRELHWIGPPPPALPEVAVAGPGWVRWTDSTVEWLTAPSLVVDPVHVGATEDWSPMAETAAARDGMLPLDDVDEWLAARLSAFDRSLARIDTRPCVTLIRGDRFRTVDEELEHFVDGSQQLHAYREWRIGATGGYGPRDHMQLEAMLNA